MLDIELSLDEIGTTLLFMIERIMAFTPALDLVFARRGWLSRQPPEARRRVLEISRRVGFDTGESIFHVGDDAGGIYGVVSGGVGTLGMTDVAGPTLGHIMRTGAWFGIGPLLTGGHRTMTFRAMEETELILVPLSELRPVMAVDPAFAGMIAQLTEATTRISVEVACEALIRDANRRVAAKLLRITAVREGVISAYPQGFRISQTDLAEMSCLSRNHTKGILKNLQARGLVTLSYNHIQIDDPEGLAAFVRRDPGN